MNLYADVNIPCFSTIFICASEFIWKYHEENSDKSKSIAENYNNNEG